MTDGRPVRSEYLAWVKRRRPARYNLSRSGAPVLALERLGLSLSDFLRNESAEDGWPPLLKRIAELQATSPDRIALAHAASTANHLAMAATLQPGDDVVMEWPVYEPLVRVAEYLGARVVPVRRREEDGWHLDPDAVKRSLTPRTRLVVVSNPHNPTGIHDDERVLTAIAREAERVGARVLVCEVYLEFLRAHGVRTAAHVSPGIMTTSSMTKVYGLDSLRMGWVVAEPAQTETIRRLNDLFSNNVAHPSERVAERALSMSDALLAETGALLDRNLAIIDVFVNSEERLSWSRPRAGTMGWVHVKGMDVDALVERLHTESGVALVPGRFFGAPEYVRISSSLPTADLEAALPLISRALR